MPVRVPSPAVSPRLHDTIGIGNLPRFPSVYPGAGCVKVTIRGGAKVDEQIANGKDGARAKLKGREVAKGSILFSYTTEVWDEASALIEAIDPLGAGYEKTWEVSHPKLARRKVTKVLFSNLEEQDSRGDTHSFTVDFSGWNEPARANLGGTKTPTKPEERAEGIRASIGSNGNIVNFGDPPVSVLAQDGTRKWGFEGPAAPDAKVVSP